MARVVAFTWDNTPNYECMTDTPPFFDDGCFEKLDFTVQQATGAGVWAIVTARCQNGAGGGDVNQDFWHNDTLKGMFFTAWKHVRTDLLPR